MLYSFRIIAFELHALTMVDLFSEFFKINKWIIYLKHKRVISIGDFMIIQPIQQKGRRILKTPQYCI